MPLLSLFLRRTVAFALIALAALAALLPRPAAIDRCSTDNGAGPLTSGTVTTLAPLQTAFHNGSRRIIACGNSYGGSVLYTFEAYSERNSFYETNICH